METIYFSETSGFLLTIQLYILGVSYVYADLEGNHCFAAECMCQLTLQCLLFKCLYRSRPRLCGLVVRVLGYRSGGPGSIPDTTRRKK
jgi:hypothetical protein